MAEDPSECACEPPFYCLAHFAELSWADRAEALRIVGLQESGVAYAVKRRQALARGEQARSPNPPTHRLRPRP
jgi:hypothetical protein